MPTKRSTRPHMVQLEILDNAPLSSRVMHRPPSIVLQRLRHILHRDVPTKRDRLELHRWLKRYDISIGGLCAVLNVPEWRTARGTSLPKDPGNGFAEISKWYAGLALEEAVEKSAKTPAPALVPSRSELTVSISGKGPAVRISLGCVDDIAKVDAILRTYFE